MTSFADYLLKISKDITPKVLALPVPPKGSEVKIVRSVYLSGLNYGDEILDHYIT